MSENYIFYKVGGIPLYALGVKEKLLNNPYISKITKKKQITSKKILKTKQQTRELTIFFTVELNEEDKNKIKDYIIEHINIECMNVLNDTFKNTERLLKDKLIDLEKKQKMIDDIANKQ